MHPVRIKGYTFQLSTPYQAGTVLTDVEAKALNGLRVENICNNLREEVNKAIAKLPEGQLLSSASLEELQLRLTDYDRAYQFTDKGLPKVKRSVLEVEARAVALERVGANSRALGIEYSQAETDALVEEFCQLPAVKEEARVRASAKSAALTDSLESLL